MSTIKDRNEFLKPLTGKLSIGLWILSIVLALVAIILLVMFEPTPVVSVVSGIYFGFLVIFIIATIVGRKMKIVYMSLSAALLVWDIIAIILLNNAVSVPASSFALLILALLCAIGLGVCTFYASKSLSAE